MEITLVDRTEGIAPEVRARAGAKLERLCKRRRELERAEIRFQEMRNPRVPDRKRCDLIMEGHGLVVRAHATGPEPVVALERAADKLARALSRLPGSKVDAAVGGSWRGA